MNVQKKTKGFTIIEVVLVIAIAGLIMLMVFIALPALQSGQRDSARKSDIGIVASAVTSLVNSDRGQFPTTAKLETYLKKRTGTGEVGFEGLSGNTSAVSVVTTGAVANVNAVDGTIIIRKAAKCGAPATGASQPLVAGTVNQFVAITLLEGGKKAFCQDS